MCIFWCLYTFPLLKYTTIKCRFVAPLLGNWRCHGNQFVPHNWGVVHMSAPNYEVDRPTLQWVIAVLTEYVTWPCDLDLLTLESRHVMSLGCSIRAKFEVYSTYRSRVIAITSFHCPPAKSLNFHVFGGKGCKISNFIFLTPKRHFLGQNDVLCVGICPKMRPVGVMKE